MATKKNKGTDCYTSFQMEMQLIQTAGTHLKDCLSPNFSASYSQKLSALTQLEQEGFSLKQALFDTTLTAFVTPLGRADIIRLSNALFAILHAVTHTVQTLSCCLPLNVSSETEQYIHLQTECATLLSQILQALPEKKKLPVLKPRITALQKYVQTAECHYHDCLKKLCRKTTDSRQLFLRYQMHHAFLSIFSAFASCAEILEEIICEV